MNEAKPTHKTETKLFVQDAKEGSDHWSWLHLYNIHTTFIEWCGKGYP